METCVDEKKGNVVYGTIGMSHSLMDIIALKEIQRILSQGDELSEAHLPHQAILSMYAGHTIFSLFYDKERVYTAIRDYVVGNDFEVEE